jgi:tetratricopeptide (TPR) repeat protein
MNYRQNWTNAWRTVFVLGFVGLGAIYPGAVDAAARDFDPQSGLEGFDTPEDQFSEPPARPRKEGTGSAPLSAPNKEDRQDLLGGETALSDPAFRAEALRKLYAQLRSAADTKAAEPIVEAIEEVWRSSGSDTVDLLMSRVDDFVLNADLDLALEILDAITEIAPDDAEAWRQRALIRFMKKDQERALSDLRRAVAIDPKHYKALRDLGAVLQQMGSKKEALEAYRKALDVNPFLEQARKAAEDLAHDIEGQDI